MSLIYRLCGILLLLFTAFMVVWGSSLAFGWIGFEKAVSFAAYMLLWFGLYFFYVTRPAVLTNLLKQTVHYLSIPLGIIGYFTFKGTFSPIDFWPLFNILFLCISAYVSFLLVKQAEQAFYLTLAIGAYLFVTLVLTLLHMQGMFENGRLVSMLVFCGFAVQTVVVMTSRRKN